MFKKLQRKILLLNMALISVVMLSAFAAVYTVTWRNIKLENQRTLQAQIPSVLEIVFSVEENRSESDSYAGFSIQSDFKEVHRVSLKYALSFSVEIDKNNNITAVNSIIDMPHETYELAVEMALAKNRDDGTIGVGGKDWMYKIGHFSNQPGQPAGMKMFDIDTAVAQNNRQIVFLDVTESKLTLRNLSLTLGVIGTAVLIIFYFVSLYFSKRAIDPVIRAWEKQRQFITDASHELKTPLCIISANCDALLESGQETVESQRRWIDYIQSGANRMTNLAGKLLTLAKMDDINPAAEAENVDISALVLDIIQSLEVMMTGNNLTCEHSIEADIIMRTDQEKAAVVITALLENAVKYAGSHIDIKLEKEKRRVLFTVKNDGAGISKEDIPMIFDRFFRGDRSRKGNDSHGLGLSIAKAAIDSLGGEIHAESEVNGQTSFSVTFPL